MNIDQKIPIGKAVASTGKDQSEVEGHRAMLEPNEAEATKPNTEAEVEGSRIAPRKPAEATEAAEVEGHRRILR